MKRLLPVFAIIFFLFISCSSKIRDVSREETQNKFSCQYNGTKRSFYLYLPEPAGYENTKLVVMLHGYGNSGRSFSMDTGFEKTALPKNYAVLYIDGIPNPSVKMSGPGWNYNYDKYGKADIEFIVELVKLVQKQYGLSKKAYAVGFSNGAFMTTKLAVEKARFFEGFVSVGGMMPEAVWNHRKGKKIPVRFFQINGTKDDVTPMRLNDSAKYNPNPAMEDVIEYFVNQSKTPPALQVVALNDKIDIYKYEGQVWWMLIKDYPHSWPSQRYCELNVNEIILDFFENQ